ncbi:MAG TPA: hypothetical protein VEX11_06855 [Acetobacteraceae bacterium]|jgi:hypothetical protein|nr:hypothetical protein [Acetobacteraceae bacterium]
MSKTEPESSPGDLGSDPIQCPHCEQVTMPNLLSDGSYICSCTAERALPLAEARGTPWDGTPFTMPAPMDDRSFMSPGGQDASGERGATGAEKERVKPKTLPEDKAQFGRDITTEDYKT